MANPNDTLYRLSFASLAFAITLPFLGTHHAYPLPSFYEEWLAGMLGLLALVPLLLVRDEQQWQIPHIIGLPLALIGMACLQRLAGIDVVPESLLLLLLYLSWGAALMLATCRLEAIYSREKLAASLAWVLCFGAILLASSGIAQRWIPGIGQPFVYRGLTSLSVINGNLAQGNSFADYLWLGIIAMLYLVAQQSLRIALALPALVMLISLSLLSGSRSVYFYAIATSLWCGIWAWHSSKERRRRLLGAALLLLPALLAVQMTLDGLGAQVVSAQRLASQGSYDPVRLTLWRAAFAIFTDHPLLGAGFDSFSREFFLRIGQFPINGAGIPEHSHNLFTEVMAEFGLFGLGIVVAFTALWLRSLDLRGNDGISFLALGLALILGLHSLLEYPLWYAHFLVIGAIFLALGDTRRRSLRLAPRQRIVAAGVIATGLAILMLMRSDYTLLEEVNQEKTHAGTALKPNELNERLTKLYADSIWRPYAAMHFAARIPLTDDDLAMRLQIVREATHFSPIRQGVFLQAALLQLDGQSEAALQQLHRAMLAHPAEIAAALQLFESNPTLRPRLTPLIDWLRQRNF